MLTVEQLRNISKAIPIRTPFLEISHPESGFNGHLLRCKADPEELGEKSLLLKAPDSSWGELRLDNDIEKRIELRKTWWKKTPSNLYVGVLLEPSKGNHGKYWIDPTFFKELTDTEFKQISQYMNKIITTHYLPSFEIFSAVWHFEQLREEPDGTLKALPPHAHFLYARKTKKITSSENNLIKR